MNTSMSPSGIVRNESGLTPGIGEAPFARTIAVTVPITIIKLASNMPAIANLICVRVRWVAISVV